MTLAKLLLAGLRQRPLIQCLNLLGLTLGVALVVALLLAGSQLRDAAADDARGIDLAVGATGSPLQLVLSAIYQVDRPSGNIDAGQWARWRAHPLVAQAVPLAMGDSVAGFRLVGTTSAFLELYGLTMAVGRAWREQGEVLIGAEVAAARGLSVGDHVVAVHGSGAQQAAAHDEHPLVVAGVLAPSGRVADRLVLIDLRDIWALHGAHGVEQHDHEGDHDHEHEHDAERPPMKASELEGREITALLLRYASPMAAGRLAREINAAPGVQAASPATEMARLIAVFNPLLLAAQALAWLVTAVAALGVFVALYQSLEQRRYDIALMRALGLSRLRVSLLLIAEALALAVAAGLLGLLFGHLAVELLARAVEGGMQLPISGAVLVPRTLLVLPLVAALALLAAALPAWRAYRMDVSRVLAAHA